MREWTHAGAAVPWLRGQGLHVAASDTVGSVRAGLTAAGWRLVAVDTAGDATRSVVQARIAASLGVPPAENADAFRDVLRDVAQTPDDRPLALLWTGATAFVHADLLGWTELTGALAEASAELWAGSEAGRRVFETVVFVGDPFVADRP